MLIYWETNRRVCALISALYSIFIVISLFTDVGLFIFVSDEHMLLEMVWK